MDAFADGGARIFAGHRDMRSRLVDEDVAAVIFVAHEGAVVIAESSYAFRVSLRRVDSLFFRVSPSRARQRLIVEVLAMIP